MDSSSQRMKAIQRKGELCRITEFLNMGLEVLLLDVSQQTMSPGTWVKPESKQANVDFKPLSRFPTNGNRVGKKFLTACDLQMISLL